jgi:hypothetical protein
MKDGNMKNGNMRDGSTKGGGQNAYIHSQGVSQALPIFPVPTTSNGVSGKIDVGKLQSVPNAYIITPSGLQPRYKMSQVVMEPEMQMFCLFVISYITLYLQGLLRSDVFRFYLKGGNALPFIEAIADSKAGVSQGFPYKITGDFDCELLIDPTLARADFAKLRSVCIIHIIHNIATVIAHRRDLWPSIMFLYTQLHKVKFDTSVNRVKLNDTGLSADDIQLSEYYNGSDFPRELPADCPFSFEIITLHRHKGDPLFFTLMKIKTRTIPAYDLIDIAIPSMDNKGIKYDWDIGTLYNIRIPIPFPQPVMASFYVVDAITLYLDQRKASTTNDREEKVRRRTERADYIRNHVLPKMNKNNTKRRLERIQHYVVNGDPYGIGKYIQNI